jgi:hypothetical protein
MAPCNRNHYEQGPHCIVASAFNKTTRRQGRASYRATLSAALLSGLPLIICFCVSRQTQCSQAVHVFDDSSMASCFLPERIIDLGFPSLIAPEYALCGDTGFCITHNSPLFLI